MPARKKKVTKKAAPKGRAVRVKQVRSKPMMPMAIGGWLILFIVILCLDIINSIVELTAFYDEISALSVLNHFIIIVFSIFLLTLFYKKSRFTPNVFIFYLWLIYLIQLVASMVYRPEAIVTYIGLVAMLIITIAVTIYFKKSKRVKNTFIR